MIIPNYFYYGFLGGLLSSITCILFFFATSSKNFYNYLDIKKELDCYYSILNLEGKIKKIQEDINDINESIYDIHTTIEKS